MECGEGNGPVMAEVSEEQARTTAEMAAVNFMVEVDGGVFIS